MFDCDWFLHGLNPEDMNVVTAFLNPDVEEEIYIQVPQGLQVPEKFNKGTPAPRLLKGLHGLKQAPGLWKDTDNTTLHRINWARCDVVIIALYVHDLILTCISSDLPCKVKAALKENYQMTDLGALEYRLHNVNTVYD